MSTLNPLDGIDLDPGDMGVMFVPGLGFRPVDGVEQYGIGKGEDCPMVFHSNEPGGQWETIVHHCEAPTEKWTFLAPPVYAAPPAIYVPPVTTFFPGVPATYYPPGGYIPPWGWIPPGSDCCYIPPTTCCGPIPPDPEMPAVDAPAAGLLLATALILVVLARTIPLARIAFEIKRI